MLLPSVVLKDYMDNFRKGVGMGFETKLVSKLGRIAIVALDLCIYSRWWQEPISTLGHMGGVATEFTEFALPRFPEVPMLSTSPNSEDEQLFELRVDCTAGKFISNEMKRYNDELDGYGSVDPTGMSPVFEESFNYFSA